MQTAGVLERVRRGDPITPTVALVAAAIYLLHGFGGELTRDTGVYAYAGQQVSRGVPPYSDILNRDGPLAHLLPGVGAWFGSWTGAGVVLGERVEFWLLSVAVVATTYVVGRTLYASRAAGLLAAAGMLAMQAVTIYATDGPREKTAMLLLVLLALQQGLCRRWFLAGVAVALATLTIQTGFFTSLPAVLVLALLSRGRRLRAVALVALGGTGTLAATVAAFGATGHLTTFLDDFLVLNTRYTHGTSPLARWAAVVHDLVGGFGPSLVLLGVGLLAAVLLPPLMRVVPAGRRPVPDATLALSASGAVGLIWDLLDFDSWPDALAVVPAAVLGATALVLVALGSPRRRAVGAALCFVLAAASATSFSLAYRSGGLARQSASVDALLDARPGSTIASIDAPQALVLAGQSNPSVYQIFAAAMVKDIQRTVPGGVPGFLRHLRDVSRPDLVAVGARDEAGLGERLRGTYAVVGTAPQWVWWARTDLGPGVLRTLRAAAAPYSRPQWRPRLTEPRAACPRPAIVHRVPTMHDPQISPTSARSTHAKPPSSRPRARSGRHRGARPGAAGPRAGHLRLRATAGRLRVGAQHPPAGLQRHGDCRRRRGGGSGHAGRRHDAAPLRRPARDLRRAHHGGARRPHLR